MELKVEFSTLPEGKIDPALEGKYPECEDNWSDRQTQDDDDDVRVSRITPAALGTSGFYKRPSFWRRVFQVQHNRSSAIVRQWVTRRRILPPKAWNIGGKDMLFTILWILCGCIMVNSHYCVFLIWDQFTTWTDEIETSNEEVESLPTPAPISYTAEQRTEALLNIWVFLQVFLMLPIFYTICFYIFTDIQGYRLRKIAWKLVIIHLSNVLCSLCRLPLNYLMNTTFLLSMAVLRLYNASWVLVWHFFVKWFCLDWRINRYWLCCLYVSYYMLLLISYLPNELTNNVIERLIVFTPLILLLIGSIFSWEIKYMFLGYEDNVSGLAVCIAAVLMPLELVRFACFVLLLIKFELNDGVSIYDIVLSVIFSLMGEIYAHTPIWQIVRNEMEMRLYERRSEEFEMWHYYFSSIRTLSEYVAPALFTSNVILLNWYSDQFPVLHYMTTNLYMLDNTIVMENIWNILLAYYLLEILSEAFCLGINKLMVYNRKSIIGNLTWSTLFMMILLVSALCDIPLLTSGFFKVLPVRYNSSETFPPSEQPST